MDAVGYAHAAIRATRNDYARRERRLDGGHALQMANVILRIAVGPAENAREERSRPHAQNVGHLLAYNCSQPRVVQVQHRAGMRTAKEDAHQRMSRWRAVIPLRGDPGDAVDTAALCRRNHDARAVEWM